jgi:hypothetical protein
MPRPLYLRGNNPFYPFDRRLGGPQNWPGRNGEEKNLAPTRTRTQTPRPSSLYTDIYIYIYTYVILLIFVDFVLLNHLGTQTCHLLCFYSLFNNFRLTFCRFWWQYIFSVLLYTHLSSDACTVAFLATNHVLLCPCIYGCVQHELVLSQGLTILLWHTVLMPSSCKV